MAIAALLLGVALCLTIVEIPLGLGNFKLAVVAIAPLGKEIVPTSDTVPHAGPSLSDRRAPGHQAPKQHPQSSDPV
jgi:uncharacterized membrane protein YccF (DUF307 family)